MDINWSKFRKWPAPAHAHLFFSVVDTVVDGSDISITDVDTDDLSSDDEGNGSNDAGGNQEFSETLRDVDILPFRERVGPAHSLPPDTRDIKICASGVYDVREHLKTKLHGRNVKSSSQHAPMTTFFRRQSVDVPESVTTAEVLFSFFVAEHNLPANVTDHFTDLVPRLFPDSAIAKAFRCKRTKTTQIVRRCLAPTATDIAIKRCRDGPFSVMVDESTDRNTDKRLAILVRYFEGETHTRLLDMPVCNFGTGQEIFDCMDGVFR